MIRKCTKCGLEKDASLFYKQKGGRDGLSSRCKDCCDEKSRLWKTTNAEQERLNNKLWHDSNKEYSKEKRKIYNDQNADQLRLQSKSYREANQAIINAKRNRRRNDDPNFRMACCLRTRLWHALKDKHKKGSAVDLLGCSLDDLRTYLESKFQPGMTWENHTFHGWHIDHIRPLSSFNLEDPEELKKACHYTNLQPLWIDDNLRKHARFEMDQYLESMGKTSTSE